MKTLIALPLIVLATVFVAAEQQTQVVPPRPPSMGQTRDTGGPQQTPQATGTGVITGQIRSVDGGRPMRRATVRLVGTSSPLSRTTMTDDRGNFEFKELPVGDFTLRANKPGYLEAIYGQKRPGSGRPGTPLSLKDAQRLEKIDLSIPKGGVITGTIVDDVNEPAFGVLVRAMRYAYRNGERTLVNAGTATTDDRGLYRIPTLVPGDYVVLATPTEANGPMDIDVRALQESLAVQNLRGGNMAFASGMPLSAAGGSMDTPPSTGYAPVFYPSTTLAMSAQTIALGPAEEKSAMDIQLQLVPLGTITGQVSGDARAIQSTTIELSDSNTGLPGLSAKTTRPGPDGRFSFTGVAPGTYSLTAKSGGGTFVSMDNSGGQVRMTVMAVRADSAVGPSGVAERGVPPAPPMWAKADVAVEGRTKNEVALVLQPGMNVSGHIAFDGTGTVPTDFSSMRVILNSATQGSVISGSALGSVDADGKFTVPDVMPGRYRVQVSPPRGWRARSIDNAGRDALDFLLDVKAGEDTANIIATFTNKPAELTGVLQDSSGKPTSDYTIILFAADQKFWTPQSRRVLSTRPSTDGKFSFRDLPAGDYKLVALEDAEPDSWFDQAFLRQLVGASMAVTIVEGERKTQDIKTVK